jgi:hypothetical protein
MRRGRPRLGKAAMTAAERMRRMRAKRAEPIVTKAPSIPVTKCVRAEIDAELPILKEFQRYLDRPEADGGWPGWQRYEGRLMYASLWRAFAAGWKARPQ